MNQLSQCWSCGHHITGGGCFAPSGWKRTENKDGCISEWVPLGTVGTINHREDLRERRFDADTIEQYKEAGMILNLGA